MVFVDLVAKLIMQQLGQVNEPDQKLHSSFKLHLYASFYNRSEAIALDLLEGLQNLNSPQFQLTLRFSEDKSKTSINALGGQVEMTSINSNQVTEKDPGQKMGTWS